MPLQGEYETHPRSFDQDLIDTILETGTTDSVRMQDLPVVLLTMKGHRSGKLRYIPLMRVEHDGTYAIVASIGGAPKHPLWYWNVKAEPHVELQDGTVKKDYVAREVTGEEKARWWTWAVEAYPPYADYQKRTTREIPVLVLEPRGE
jgi:deazaflavin-dependent oxidoreductase (nitroreductase family)